MNINQSKYLVVPKVAVKGCNWDLLEWPLSLKQLPKTSKINKSMFLSVEFPTKWASKNCATLLDTIAYIIFTAVSSTTWLNNTQRKQLDRNAIQNSISILESKIQNGIKFTKTLRHLSIQNFKRDLSLSSLVKLPRFPMNHWDHSDNLSISPINHLYFRHTTDPYPSMTGMSKFNTVIF